MGQAKKVGVDFQVLDNGTVQFTVTPVDAVGNSTTLPDGASAPVFTSSDSTILAVSPNSADTTGMSAIGTPAKLGTGAVVTATVTLADGVTTITGSSNPVDVIAGPANSLVVAEQ